MIGSIFTVCMTILCTVHLLCEQFNYSCLVIRMLLLLLLSHFSLVQLCNPIDGSPPGSAVPGILQARTLEWVAISFSNVWKWKVKVKSLSRAQLFATPWTAACQASLFITNSWSLPKLMIIESVMPSSHLILSSPSPPALNLSQHQGLFKWVSSSHQVAKVLEFQLQHQSFQWTSRTDFL